MYLPGLNTLKVTHRSVSEFGGMNRSGVCDENQFHDTYALSSHRFPALATAEPIYELDRIETGEVTVPVFFNNRGLGCVTSFREDVPDIHTLLYNGKRITNFEFRQGAHYGNVAEFNSETLLIRQNTAYSFDPNGVLNKMGYTHNVQPAQMNPGYNETLLRLSLVYDDKSEIGEFRMGVADEPFPEDAAVGDCFARELECYRLIYKDAEDSEKDVWQPVVSVRLRLDVGEYYTNFKADDYIRLEGLKYWCWAVRHLKELDRFVRIDTIDGQHRLVSTPMPLFEDYYNILKSASYPTNDIGYGNPIIDNDGNDLYILEGSVSACMPSMDFICTGANRVWGCSTENGEIYASELGNARNFSVFEGLSGDSYAVTVGSPGDFTACCNYLGTPVFFKEHEMIVVTGSRPVSFTLNSYSIRGVPKDCPNGACVVGDTLYYISYDGVYAYNGSSSVCVSDELRDDVKKLTDAVLGGDGDILYVSGNIDGNPVQYSYDIRRRIWHRSGDERVTGYVRYSDATLQICDNEGVSGICTLGGRIPRSYRLTGAEVKEKEWHWETGDITYNTPDKKYIRKLSLDTKCSGPSDVYVSYDGGVFRHIGHFPPHERGTGRIYVFPRRCDHFRIRMTGEGEMMLYAFTKDVEEAREDG